MRTLKDAGTIEIVSMAEELRMRRDHARKDSRSSKQIKKLREALEKVHERCEALLTKLQDHLE